MRFLAYLPKPINPDHEEPYSGLSMDGYDADCILDAALFLNVGLALWECNIWYKKGMKQNSSSERKKTLPL